MATKTYEVIKSFAKGDEGEMVCTMPDRKVFVELTDKEAKRPLELKAIKLKRKK